MSAKTNKTGIVELEIQQLFTTQDDRSTYGLPWDEADINAEYHY